MPLPKGRLEDLLFVRRPARSTAADAFDLSALRRRAVTASLVHATRRRTSAERMRRTEQRPDDLAQLLGLGQRGVSRAAEHAPKGLGIGAGADAQAQTADAPAARLAERTPRVGRAVHGLVAVVVRQPVGQHDEQLPRRPAVVLQHRRAMSDRRTQPRVRAGHEAAEPLHHERVRSVAEALDRHDAAPRNAPASERRRAPRDRRARGARASTRLRRPAAARARSSRSQRARPRSPRRRAGAARRDRAGGEGCR